MLQTQGPSADRPPAYNSEASRADVIVVDDDTMVRDTVVGLLNMLGHSAAGIAPAGDLVDSIISSAPSVLLLDLSLGRSDGVAVLRELAERNFGGSICLFSGHGPDTIGRVQEIGKRSGLNMLAPVCKPVTSAALRAAIVGSSVVPTSRRPAAVGTSDVPAADFDLPEAIRNRWLEVWYQPTVKLATGALRGAEALVRLRHPRLGLIPPSCFIPSATADAYESMTAFVIDAVARDEMELRRKGWSLPLSINASLSLIQRPAFLDMIRDAWPDTSARPPLIVEVTEDDIVGDMTVARDVATQLKLYGVSISIDDFGAGYSSFSRLRELPFSELKLDKSFVLGAGSNEKQHAFCVAAAAIARNFGMEAVAEGIETEEDLAAVVKAGFGAGQGYIFAKPRPFDEFVSGLAKQRTKARPETVWDHRRPQARAHDPSSSRSGLSHFQQEILRWAALGKSNTDIATILGISARTVAYHVSEILAKLGVASRSQAIALMASEASRGS